MPKRKTTPKKASGKNGVKQGQQGEGDDEEGDDEKNPLSRVEQGGGASRRPSSSSPPSASAHRLARERF